MTNLNVKTVKRSARVSNELINREFLNLTFVFLAMVSTSIFSKAQEPSSQRESQEVSRTTLLNSQKTTPAITSVSVENAWIRVVPPESPNSAAFMTIKNATDKDIYLIRAESGLSKSVELHEMSVVEGVMKMRPIGKIKIPAKGSVELKKGGLHIMLIGLKAPLNKGEQKTLTLHFDNGLVEKVTATQM